MQLLLREASISFSACKGVAIIYNKDAGTLFSGEGEDDIEPFKEIEVDEEQLEELDDR